jgi:hypothetical protein
MDNIVTNELQKRLSGPQIADILDKLTLDRKRPWYFKGYGGMHNWTNKCGLWELSYMQALILMQNIDVMHQERNMGERIITTCVGLLEKTKDNRKAQKDLAGLCSHPTPELNKTGGKPRASLCLKPQQRKAFMWWTKGLKFPDGYAAGLRRFMNVVIWKLSGLKSHDYHKIMERHLPGMFQGYLDDAMWMVLIEVIYFYRQLCAIEIIVEMMDKLEETPMFLCNREIIFPPKFLIQCKMHLLIHLPYEAKASGRVQYRWMCHIERSLRYLKPMAGNRARV